MKIRVLPIVAGVQTKACAGCDKIFIPTISNKFCRSCFEEVLTSYHKLKNK